MLNRLLIVEDDQSISIMLRIALRQFFDVTVAETLSAALGVIRANSLAAIILDLGLRDCDGVETVKRVVEACGDIPVLVLTGSIVENLPRLAYEAGAVDFLTKPLGEIDSLPPRIEAAILKARRAARRTARIASLESRLKQKAEEIRHLRHELSQARQHKGMSAGVQVAWIGALATLLTILSNIVIEFIKKGTK
jgi:DNA-binding response OmpR family regulator